MHNYNIPHNSISFLSQSFPSSLMSHDLLTVAISHICVLNRMVGVTHYLLNICSKRKTNASQHLFAQTHNNECLISLLQWMQIGIKMKMLTCEQLKNDNSDRSYL